MSCAFDHQHAREWFTAAELAELDLPGLPSTKRGVAELARREGWAEAANDMGRLARPRKARGGGVEFHLQVLPEAARSRLLARSAPAAAPSRDETRESAWARFDRLPSGLKAMARERLEIIQRVEALMRAGLKKGRACETVVEQAAREARAAGKAKAPFSVSTLYAWFALIDGAAIADRLAFLAPAYVGRTATAECSEAAWDLFKAEYLTNSRQSAGAAYAKVLAIGAEAGWTVPSLKALTARVEREFDPITLVYLREGEPGLERRFPTPRRDVTEYDVLQSVNVDGHELDLMVEWADGTKGRPVMVGIQDTYSRKMLVTVIGRSESADLVRRAFAELFEDHGIPEHIFFDNGRAFASKWLTGGTPNRYRFKVRPEDPIGLLGQFGCQVHFVRPYAGRSKPIERAWRDFADGFARSGVFVGAYTGPNTSAKPADYGSRAVPLAEVMTELAFFKKLHNARPNRRTQTARGVMSFDQVYAEGAGRALIRTATPEQLRLALLASEPVTVRRQTCQIHLADNTYFNEALWGLEGEKVVVRFDPDDLHKGVHVYRLDGVWVCEAACVETVGFASAEAARDIGRRKARLMKKARDLSRDQRLLDARRLAALRPGLADSDPEPDSVVVAPVFGSLALQARPAPREEARISDAEIFELHARAVGRLRPLDE